MINRKKNSVNLVVDRRIVLQLTLKKYSVSCSLDLVQVSISSNKKIGFLKEIILWLCELLASKEGICFVNFVIHCNVINV